MQRAEKCLFVGVVITFAETLFFPLLFPELTKLGSGGSGLTWLLYTAMVLPFLVGVVLYFYLQHRGKKDA